MQNCAVYNAIFKNFLPRLIFWFKRGYSGYSLNIVLIYLRGVHVYGPWRGGGRGRVRLVRRRRRRLTRH